MKSASYASDYLHRALRSDILNPPDENQAGEFSDIVATVHNAHLQGGKEHVATVWNTIALVVPNARVLYHYRTRYLHVSQLSQLPEVQYLLEDYPLYDYGINMLVGDRGTGKSMIAVDIACKVAQNHPVCYIAAEGAHTYHSRCLAWHDYRNCDWGNLYFFNEPVNFMDPQSRLDFIQTVTEKEKPKLIVVDTVARCMDGFDENSTRDMSLFVKAITEIQREFGCSVLLIHHTSKMGKTRGSSALAGALESIMMLRRTDDGITLYNYYDSTLDKTWGK